jgi:hypothetical protein
MRIAFFLFMLVVLAGPTSQAQARWKAEYASHTRQQRDWYESQTTTAATRERIKASWYVSCCHPVSKRPKTSRCCSSMQRAAILVRCVSSPASAAIRGSM